MYRLTQRRKQLAREVLERYTRQLHDKRWISAAGLESELRKIWDLGYQTLKHIMIDILANHPEYAHLAAFYMEHSNASGVVVEFQRPLARLYGLNWYFDESREAKRSAYWERAFAVISQFDLERMERGTTIVEVSSAINQKLIEHFLRHPTRLRKIDSRGFEQLVAELFDGFGFRVELTKPTRDNGRDVIAIGNDAIATSKYLIECKRYKEANKVGIEPVRSLYGVVNDEGATKGIIVITSSFTSPAQEFLDRHEWELEGRDLEGIVEWLKHYQKLRFPPNEAD